MSRLKPFTRALTAPVTATVQTIDLQDMTNCSLDLMDSTIYISKLLRHVPHKSRLDNVHHCH